MKKALYLFLAISIFLLSGCAARSGEPGKTGIRVSIEETPWTIVEDNGQLVKPGEDAVFHITALDGFVLTQTDYSGEATICQDGSDITLTLSQVSFPTYVKLRLSNENYVLRYEPNGGDGEAYTVLQEKKYHLRPNTENALTSISR